MTLLMSSLVTLEIAAGHASTCSIVLPAATAPPVALSKHAIIEAVKIVGPQRFLGLLDLNVANALLSPIV